MKFMIDILTLMLRDLQIRNIFANCYSDYLISKFLVMYIFYCDFNKETGIGTLDGSKRQHYSPYF